MLGGGGAFVTAPVLMRLRDTGTLAWADAGSGGSSARERTTIGSNKGLAVWCRWWVESRMGHLFGAFSLAGL